MQSLNNKINVLVFGAGAREHAIADSISKSPLLNRLFLAQGGSFNTGSVIEFDDYEQLAKKCVQRDISLAIIGPEEPLCNGIVDIFKQYNISCIGVDKYFSQLESSKLFGKKFMAKYDIKNAKCFVVNQDTVFKTLNFDVMPMVIKADGLCKGKGVKIVYDSSTALKTIIEYLSGKFGDSSKTILLEEFLDGPEMSLMSLWDGKTLLNFLPSRDFKRLNNSPDAPNTGGMGAFCPVDLTLEQKEKLNLYELQLENALKSERADFVGFLYSGLIWTEVDGVYDWYVLEYNVRLGDPETQAILPHLKTDFLEILKAAVDKNLNKIELEYEDDYSACLVIACEGYPQKPKDGYRIMIPEDSDIKIFNAGVKVFKDKLYSKGGRILSLCTASKKPFEKLRDFAQKIEMRYKYYRDDIDIN